MAATAHVPQVARAAADPDPLPDEQEGDEVDPREELIRRLLEYQKYKEPRSTCTARPVVGRNVWTRGRR